MCYSNDEIEFIENNKKIYLKISEYLSGCEVGSLDYKIKMNNVKLGVAMGLIIIVYLFV